MTKKYGSDDCLDPEYRRTGGRKSVDDQNLDAKQKAAYTTVTINGRTEPMWKAYSTSLKNAILRGDENARAELDKLLEHHQQIFERKERQKASPVHDAVEKQKRIDAAFENVQLCVALRLMSEIFAEYEKAFGQKTFSRFMVPHYLDVDKLVAVGRRMKRKMKKKNPNYEVGYGRTPCHTRFTNKRNPRLKAKPKDFFDRLAEDLDKTVTMTSGNGKKVRKTVREVNYLKQFQDAINGKRRARAEVRKILIRLSNAGRLCPPERPRRFRRSPKPVDAQSRMMSKVLEVKLVPSLKRDIIERCERYYGRIPDFTTKYERELPKVEEIEGWAKFESDRAKQTELGEIALTGNPEPLPPDKAPKPYPTRSRTRSTPLSRSPHPKRPTEGN